ncbi:E3 ubiquitin-protein ligase RBBP6 isoform X2 [Orussus abietinus]|nr:E3 ubiquitin-protein ligase RBBP6 isoform X2 [Orussus abietinus]
MSKARILSILSGQTLLESSDTSETDGSGPSLEIISDTEEWLTDSEVVKKEDQVSSKIQKTKKEKIKSKAKSQVSSDLKKNQGQKVDQEKVGGRNKHKQRNEIKANAKVKVEGEKASTSKEKEGDSLLDLLELEMRARAIRALIRKEEDIIPGMPSAQNTGLDKTQKDRKEKGSNFSLMEGELRKLDRRIIEKSLITGKQGGIGDDEDVVLVVQPTPTIELLSSDSSDEEHKNRINQRLQNERIAKKSEDTNKITDTDNQSVNKTPCSNENLAISETVQTAPKEANVNVERLEPGEIKDGMDNSAIKTGNQNKVDSVELATEGSTAVNERVFKKLKKRPHTRRKNKTHEKSKPKEHKKGICNPVEDTHEEKPAHNKSVNSTLDSCNTKEIESLTESGKEEIQKGKIQRHGEKSAKLERSEESKLSDITDSEKIKIEANGKAVLKEDKVYKPQNLVIEDDKSIDMDVIIDLDDYPDDMDEMEYEKDTVKISNTIKESCDSIKESDNNVKKDASSTETWATRYYKTDDVQNVIKESKIQSEIRKRLRERQRLSKLNNSPNLNSNPPITEEKDNKTEINPTGSVEEYLALKGIASSSLSNSSSSNSSINIFKKAKIEIDNDKIGTPDCNSTAHVTSRENNKEDSDNALCDSNTVTDSAVNEKVDNTVCNLNKGNVEVQQAKTDDEKTINIIYNPSVNSKTIKNVNEDSDKPNQVTSNVVQTKCNDKEIYNTVSTLGTCSANLQKIEIQKLNENCTEDVNVGMKLNVSDKQ